MEMNNLLSQAENWSIGKENPPNQAQAFWFILIWPFFHDRQMHRKPSDEILGGSRKLQAILGRSWAFRCQAGKSLRTPFCLHLPERETENARLGKAALYHFQLLAVFEEMGWKG